jgi:hypothetical protein
MKGQLVGQLRRWVILSIARHTPDCHHMTRLISRSMDHKLPLGTRIRMRLHYGICVWCERYLQQIAFVKRVSHSFAEHSAACSAEAISPQAKQRLQAALASYL